MTLLHETLHLLRQRPRSVTYEKIEEATGLKASWLSMLASDDIKDPSVNSIQKLYEFLSGKKLNVNSKD